MSYNPKVPRPVIIPTNHLNSNYSPKPDCGIIFPENSPVTKQEFKDECDINNIMARYQYNGIMPVMNETAPQYLDVTGIEFQSAMEFVAGAQTLFNELPSAIRNRFENDPAKFLDFCNDKNNYEEMGKLGLLKPESERVYKPAPQGAPLVNPEPSPIPDPA